MPSDTATPAQVTIDLKVTAEDGSVVDERAGVTFVVDDGSECRGVADAVLKMTKGEVRKLTIQPNYGPDGTTGVLTAVLKVVDFPKAKQSWELQDDESRIAEITAIKERGTVLFKAKENVRPLVLPKGTPFGMLLPSASRP